MVDKIHLELQTTFPNFSPNIPINFDCLLPTSLPYTNAVFNESLRLYPPVPIEIKECTDATTFPDGTCLPKGALVMWIPWAMGRSRKIWGDDADQFRPERWLQQKGSGKHSADDPTDEEALPEKKECPKLASKSAFEFPVFNGGPRSCLGKKMAEVLAMAVITKLVSKYDFIEIFEKGPLSSNGVCEVRKERISQNSLTLPMAGGLPCYVRRREMFRSRATSKQDESGNKERLDCPSGFSKRIKLIC